jgi:5'-methylthioadenosine phosphorylase
VLDGPDYVLVQRHGLEGYRDATRVDHRANLAALAEIGCDRALAIGSVGGLRPELGVGTILCPDDFIALHLGLSAHGGRAGERVPGFDGSWRERVLSVWRRLAGGEIVDGGVYWQAIGPRFETPAEIRLIAAHADVIGMTIASECVAAGELGLAYAAVCVVDNLANGIGKTELELADVEAGRARNHEALAASLAAVLPRVA